MTMSLVSHHEGVLEDVISSYEMRIQSIETLFDATCQVFEGFQDSVVNTRLERDKINDQLRENLARHESLRRRDFDCMMNSVFAHMDQSEQDIRSLAKRYLNDQSELVHQLREELTSFTQALVRGQGPEVEVWHAHITEILSKQDENKVEVTAELNELQQGQQQTSKMIKDLLDKGEALRLRDFKTMLCEFKKQRKGRIASQAQRRQDVKAMLDEFKAQRTETERDRLLELQEA